jgi:hypothetical protein
MERERTRVRNRALQLAFWWLVDWLDAIEADYQAASVEMEALQFALAFPRHIGPGQFGWAVVHERMQREHHRSRLRQPLSPSVCGHRFRGSAVTGFGAILIRARQAGCCCPWSPVSGRRVFPGKNPCE